MVAQLVELLICNQMVGGSSPLRSSLFVAQLVRAPDCGSGGREFKSRQTPHSSMAQLDSAPDYGSEG